MRTGPRGRELDQPEGGRGRLPRQGREGPALRRRRRRDALRRGGPGRHGPPQDRDRRTRVRVADRRGGLRPRGHHHRPEHPGDRDRARGARRLREGVHRGHPRDQAPLPRRQDLGRRLEPQLLVPRERARAPGDPLGVPVPRPPGGSRHGDRERGPAPRLRRHRPRPARARRGHHLQPAARRDRAHGHVRRDGQGRRGRTRGGPRMARGHRRGAPLARPRPRDRRLHRGGYRGGPARLRQAARRDRGAADGRDEDRRRPLRRREDVPAAGREERPCDEEGRRAPRAVHGRREAARDPRRRHGQTPGPDRDGHREGRRPRHRQEHRRSGARLQQLRGDRPRRDGARRPDPRHGDRGRLRHRGALRSDHAVARRDGERRERDAAARDGPAVADRRGDDLTPAHGGADRARVRAAGRARARRLPRGGRGLGTARPRAQERPLPPRTSSCRTGSGPSTPSGSARRSSPTDWRSRTERRSTGVPRTSPPPRSRASASSSRRSRPCEASSTGPSSSPRGS